MDQNLFRKILRNPERVASTSPASSCLYPQFRRTRRIMDKWRTLLSRDVTAMKQFTCLNSDYSCNTRNKWLLLGHHQIGSVDSAAPLTDCCAIDQLLRHRQIYRWRSAIYGANPSIARDISISEYTLQ